MLHPSFWVLRGTIPACHLSSPPGKSLCCTPIFDLAGYHSGLPLVVPMGSAHPIAIGDGRSSIRSPDSKIRAVEIARLEFVPFSAAWKIHR